ncbi:MAG: DUF255 domain-containing protein [Gammaproteobacteria bacterium]
MLKRMLLCLLLLAGSPGLLAKQPAKPAANVLARSASPYLAMHAHDPVHWHLWNARTFALARAQKKLLFVTSGYFACRWCHVMQHESFQNRAIAALLNRDYIPVVVDRELMPALDARLIDFVERTQGAGGWPLNVFVTPEGYPLIGTVYQPPKHFEKILRKLEQQWKKDRHGLMALARSASQSLSTAVVTTSAKLPATLPAKLEQAFLQAAAANEDDMQGGFGQQNKFPAVPQLDALLAAYQRQPGPQLKQFLQLTLDNMATLGLRDQLDGGFFRYCVDPNWHVPHFEKMLYSNALLARLYLRAGAVFHDSRYTRVGQETLDFMLHSMRGKDSGYIASLSAVDAQGVDGGYYLWDKQQIKSLLDPAEWAVVRILWPLNGPPDAEHGYHLRQVRSVQAVANKLQLDVAVVRQRLDSARKKLLRARSTRQLPRDTKQLAGWNGLVLSALATGARLTHAKRDRQAARALHDYLYSALWDGQELARAIGGHDQRSPGTLQDYAYVIAGVMDWWQLTRDPRDAAWLQQLITSAWQRFYGAQGWQRAQHMLLKYGTGNTLISDSALPSSASVLIASTYRYARLTQQRKLQRRALRALNVGRDEIENDPFWYATQIAAMQQLTE